MNPPDCIIDAAIGMILWAAYALASDVIVPGGGGFHGDHATDKGYPNLVNCCEPGQRHGEHPARFDVDISFGKVQINPVIELRWPGPHSAPDRCGGIAEEATPDRVTQNARFVINTYAGLRVLNGFPNYWYISLENEWAYQEPGTLESTTPDEGFLIHAGVRISYHLR